MSVAAKAAVLARLTERGPDEVSRVRAGACSTTPPEILHFLARDRSVTVRAAVAMNGGTGIETAHALARDEDERVRALIARKLGALAPNLRPDDQEALRRATYAALTALVADEAVRVRAALADVLKEMPDAPRALVLALAHDTADSVAEPVIRLSPLLTEQDLLQLLRAQPAAVTALAVARRPDLTERVSDAIAATASVNAIGTLLANRSAAIRETTLDALIARAADYVAWHEPMVRRPALTPASARKLSEIVATHLLEVLAARPDLGPGVADDLARRLADRLARTPPDAAAKGPPGGVTETMLLHAAQRGEAAETARLLAAAADVKPALVERAASLRSAKALVSLIWRAGFGMQVAGPVQALLGRLAPNALLAADADGGFPLTREEMRWQIDFLQRIGR